jgi:DNA-binding PadR family transcriptional regulator
VETPLSAKAALLQSLTVPGYGLDLLKRVQRDSAGLIRLRLGSIYPALRAMEQEGLVAVRPGQSGGHRGRPRRYYELTLRGVRAAMSQRGALLSLLGGPQVRVTPDVGKMRRQLESCSALSGSVVELERRVQRVVERRR